MHRAHSLESAYCINLRHRYDRWKRVNEQLKRFPPTFKLHRFDAIYNKNNPRKGCAESHLAQLVMAKENNMEFICVLEDDVRFTDSAYEKLQQALSNLPEDWDILLGGCYEPIVGTQVSDNIYKTCYAQGTHCIIYRQTSFAKLLEYNEQPPGIDDYISYLAAIGEINLYHVYPTLAYQDAGYSDIKMNYFDCNHSNHHLTEDFSLCRKIFLGISKQHSIQHLQQHARKINDNYLKSQALLLINKYYSEISGSMSRHTVDTTRMSHVQTP